jgi:chitin-binding protein
VRELVQLTHRFLERPRREKGEHQVRILRRLGALSATTVLATGLAVAIAPPAAQAHGVAMFPGSRTFLCYQDGLRENGQIIPFNPACGQAVQSTGTTPLYNWFAVLRSDGGGRSTGFIPDNQLCSGGVGGPFDFTAYNANRADWPKTHLTSGATYTLRYSNWAAHPGAFQVYLTRQGWTPTMPLNWSDLTSIGSATNPPVTGPPGAFNYYFWDQTLPTGRSGPAMLFIQWVRSDSQENFYSCSDIVFDGGNGQVTGVGPNQTGTFTTPPTSTSTSTTTTTSRPPTSTTTSTSTSTTSTSQPSGACSATFRVVGTPWSTGFQGEITVRAGTAAVNGWTVNWTNPAGQLVQQLWNAAHTPSGQNSTAKNLDYNRSIAANGSTTFGFLASPPSSGAPTVSNLTCTSP